MWNTAKALALFAGILTTGVHATDSVGGSEPDAVAPLRPDLPRLSGAELFAAHCAMCHKPVTLAQRLRSAPILEDAKARMAAFLARHGRSDADADAAIIDYLAKSSFP